MTKITIDKNVPLPSRSKYPYFDMEIGDSFFAAEGSSEKITGSWAYQKRRYGRKFSYRKWNENGNDGFRVWKVA